MGIFIFFFVARIMAINKCDFCGVTFSRRGALIKHIKKRHEDKKEGGEDVISTKREKTFVCPFCQTAHHKSRKELSSHVKTDHSELLVFQKTSAIGGKICIFRKDLTAEENKTLADFCNSKKIVKEIFHLLKSELVARSVFRISVVITANYEIPDVTEENPIKSVDNDTFSLRTKGVVINEFEGDRAIKNKIKSLLMGALSREEDLLTRGSGWRFENLHSCDILLYDICHLTRKRN